MAKDVANDLNYYLLIDKEYESDLRHIRVWNNLKVAFDAAFIWVKDLDYAQANSTEVKSIPYKTVFYSNHGKLFLQNSLLPDRLIPSLLWTSIDRALPIKLPSFNHNYFGVNETLEISITPSQSEAESIAMVTTVFELSRYLTTAPAIRLQKIQWVLLPPNKVFLLGKPLLPIPGDTYWKRNDFILPSGYDLELFGLSESINQRINPKRINYIVWNIDSSYFTIDKIDLQPLKLSSFRQTISALEFINSQS